MRLHHPKLERLDTVLRDIRAGGLPALVLGTPPPRSDTAAIPDLLKHEQRFVAAAAAAVNTGIANVALTNPALINYGALVQDMTGAVAEAHGAMFVRVPAAACTPDGSLRREYWSTDATHANPAYGALMLAEALRPRTRYSSTQANRHEPPSHRCRPRQNWVDQTHAAYTALVRRFRPAMNRCCQVDQGVAPQQPCALHRFRDRNIEIQQKRAAPCRSPCRRGSVGA